MNNNDLIKHIESKYNVKSIKYKNLNVWLELRNRIYTKIKFGEESAYKISNKTYISVLISMFYGFFKWFKKYDAWFFSNKVNRILIDGYYYDRIFDYIGSQIDSSLFIELTTERHYKKSQVYSKNIVSKSLLIFIEKIVSIFVSLKRVDLTEYNKILKEFDVEISPVYGLKKMISQYYFMRFLLAFNKPKFVFISPSYDNYGYVKAFKEKGIKVIEVQHGVIIKEHYGYNVQTEFSRDYFVDYLLTFGENEKLVFNETNFGISRESVIPVGNFYLDHILEYFKSVPKIENLKSKYTKSFVVSLQELEVPLRLIPLLIESAHLFPDYLFILKPRHKDMNYYTSTYSLPSNMVVIENVNVYQLIMETDFHISVYSTCALEAPALGKMNILYDINGMAKSHLGEVLTNAKTTRYVSELDEFNLLIESLIPIDAKIVISEHKDVIEGNYKTNINNFLKQIND